jgi:uncharacterized protein (TIGR02001 family)
LKLRRRASPKPISPLAAASIGLLFVGLACPGTVGAQVGGSVVIESDDRFRGVSIDHEQGDVRLSLSYDHVSGAYAGLSAAAVGFGGLRGTSLLTYLGFSAPAGAALRWDAGLTQARISGDSRRDYAEIFAGLFAQRWGLRAAFAPDYYGGGLKTLYVEGDLNWPLTAVGRVVAHLGSLRSLDGGGQSHRVDARIGTVIQIGEVGLQLAWTSAAGQGRFAVPRGQHRNALVISSSYEF